MRENIVGEKDRNRTTKMQMQDRGLAQTASRYEASSLTAKGPCDTRRARRTRGRKIYHGAGSKRRAWILRADIRVFLGPSCLATTAMACGGLLARVATGCALKKVRSATPDVDCKRAPYREIAAGWALQPAARASGNVAGIGRACEMLLLLRTTAMATTLP